MSFGGNPPWQRNSIGNAGQQNAIASLQSQMMNANFVGFQNLAMAQQAPQNNLALLPQIGAANINNLNNTNAMFTNSQAIQYQNARSGLNPNAFAPVQSATQILQHHQSQGNQQTNQNQLNQSAQVCNKIGTVTKYQNNGYGFVDDEIIFHKNVCRGLNPPKIGDRVLVEATCNNNSSFKWNATLIQQVSGSNQRQQSSLQQSQMPQQRAEFSNNNSSQSQNSYANNSSERSTSSALRGSGSNQNTRQSSPIRKSSPDRSIRREEEERKRQRRDERERYKWIVCKDNYLNLIQKNLIIYSNRERKHERERDRSPRKISPRRKTRPIPRYNVQVPKINLNAYVSYSKSLTFFSITKSIEKFVKFQN